MTNGGRKIRAFSGPPPRKQLGQHFLLDEEIAEQIVSAMNPVWTDRALEIGPGRGVLLRFLLKSFQRVTAVEIDLRLQKSLHRTFGGHPGLNLIFDDFLKFDLAGFLAADATPVKIVGNVPYALSGAILFHLLDAATEQLQAGQTRLRSATLMLQREVAQRIAAPPGSRTYGAITVLRSLCADATLLFTVPPTAFSPPPKVTSAVVRLDFYDRPRYTLQDRLGFSQLVHHVFSQRRKMLKNTLGTYYAIHPDWQQINFDFTRRPEELSIAQFAELFQRLQLGDS
jgi:16S rRNA (adenine1518-N6/adenine1519-N6)-dimethyltransferase